MDGKKRLFALAPLLLATVCLLLVMGQRYPATLAAPQPPVPTHTDVPTMALDAPGKFYVLARQEDGRWQCRTAPLDDSAQDVLAASSPAFWRDAVAGVVAEAKQFAALAEEA